MWPAIIWWPAITGTTRQTHMLCYQLWSFWARGQKIPKKCKIHWVHTKCQTVTAFFVQFVILWHQWFNRIKSKITFSTNVFNFPKYPFDLCYTAGLEPFGGAKTGNLIASIDSPQDHTILLTGRRNLAFVRLNFVILRSTLSSFSCQKKKQVAISWKLTIHKFLPLQTFEF